MNKIKLKKRTWTNTDGTKGSSYRFFYNENGGKKYKQSPNRQWLLEEAARILFRIGNVKTLVPLPLIDTWEAYYKKQKSRMYESNSNIRSTTLNEYESHYNTILHICGNVDLRTIGEDYIGRFLVILAPIYDKQTLVSGFAKMSYRKKLFDTFSRIYNYHVGQGKPIKSNIFKTGNYFTDEERADMKYVPIGKALSKNWLEEWDFNRIKTIIDKVECEPTKLMFKIMAETSCRPSEARASQRKSFNFLKNRPTFEVIHSVDDKKNLVPPKTFNGYRTLEIGTDLKDDITDYMIKMPQDQEFLFLNSRGKFIDLGRMIKALNKALKSLNLVLPIQRKTYFFRHWNASMWAYTGKYTNAMDLAKDMGDKDINFVNDTYIKKYGVNKDSERYSEHHNNNYKWN